MWKSRSFYDSDQGPLRANLRRYRVPMLIVHSTRDPHVPVAAGRDRRAARAISLQGNTAAPDCLLERNDLTSIPSSPALAGRQGRTPPRDLDRALLRSHFRGRGFAGGSAARKGLLARGPRPL